MKGYRVWAEIDLAALRHNVGVVREAVGPRTRIMAVVKADAYGHGALPVAWTALDAGCDMLGVGDSGEAIELREGGMARPILILGAIVEEEIAAVVQHDVSVTVHSTDLLPLLNAEAGRRGRRLGVHLKVDTGMTRLGVSTQRAPGVARAILSCPNLRLDGLSTHLASPADPEATQMQIERFEEARQLLRRQSICPPIIHVANSVGLFTRPDAHYDMVRPGIALYGMDPGPFAEMGLDLRPVLTLKTRIAYLKGVAADTPVGYGGAHRTSKATHLATCPVGYNDGYPYTLSGKGASLPAIVPTYSRSRVSPAGSCSRTASATLSAGYTCPPVPPPLRTNLTPAPSRRSACAASREVHGRSSLK